MDTREELRQSLPADYEYRHAYADEILNLMACTQIRLLREQQGMSQDELAKAIGTTQTAVSRLENVNYSAWNTRTLRKIAKAFDLRLRITFENFGTLWRDVCSINRSALERARTIEEDPEFQDGVTDQATVETSGPSVIMIQAEESANATGVVFSNVVQFRHKAQSLEVGHIRYSNPLPLERKQEAYG